MRSLLWFTVLVIISSYYLEVRGQQNACSLDNGRCTYRIELVDGCTTPKIGVKQHDIQSGSNGNSDVQSDIGRINSIEQHLLNVKLEHSRMILDLENKIAQLSSPEEKQSHFTKPKDIRHEASKQLKTSNTLNKLPVDGKRYENKLLNNLQNEFSKLRKILYDTKKKLRETEKLLRLLRKQHNKTKLRLTETTRQLNKTEFDLQQKNKILEHTETKLEKCEKEKAVFEKYLLESKRQQNKTLLIVDQKSSQLTKTELELEEKSRLLDLTKEKLDKSERERKQLEKLLNESQRQNNKTENLLNQRNQELNKTNLELEESNSLFTLTKDKLDRSELDKKQLVNESNEKSKELDSLQEELKLCKKEIKSKEIQIWEVTSDMNKLKKELEDCRWEVKQLKALLEKALIKYHDLNVRHENVTEELNETRYQLIQCSREKISSYCGFEDETICGYTQENNTDDLDWIQWSMTTPSDWTGPEADHTCGNEKGHYMYVEATAMGGGNRARMTSPKYHGYDEQCVEFYYHMYGNDVGTLNVYLLVESWDNEELPTPVWRAYGNQGNIWTVATLSIPEEVALSGYKVVFEVMTRAGYAGDTAIDDIRIIDGKCEGATSMEQWRVRQRNKVIDTLRSESQKLRLAT